MAKILRDFKCDSCGSEQERFVDTNLTELQCDCGGLSYRVIGMPTVKLEGITGDFPGAHSRWAKIREDNARIKARRQ